MVTRGRPEELTHITVKSAEGDPKPGENSKLLKPLSEIQSMDDLLPPGAKPGTIPTDLEQSTGLERLEILGKMQGVDIFDMKPLDASRKGTCIARWFLSTVNQKHAPPAHRY